MSEYQHHIKMSPILTALHGFICTIISIVLYIDLQIDFMQVSDWFKHTLPFLSAGSALMGMRYFYYATKKLKENESDKNDKKSRS